MKIITKPFGVLQTIQREIADLHDEGFLPQEIVLNEHEYEQLKSEAKDGGLMMYTYQNLVDNQMYFNIPVKVVPKVDIAEVTQGLLDLANAGKAVLLSDEEVKKRRKKVKPEDYPVAE